MLTGSQAANQKRLLSLDGGGILGLISLMKLKKIEDELKAKSPDPDAFRLCDFFDYFAGTSTGAIIAAGLTVGKSVDELITLYEGAGKSMFVHPWVWNRLRHRYKAGPLKRKLRQELGDKTIAELKASNGLKSELLIITRNATTESAWAVSTNPHAKYFNADKSIKLWQLVRASTAAPFYFPREKIRVLTENGSEKAFLFEDGGVTAYNNPSFLLYRMATEPAHRLAWPTGEEQLMLVSVGTGQATNVNLQISERGSTPWLVAQSVPGDLMHAISTENDINCRVFGRCVHGSKIDSVLGDMIPLDQTKNRIPLTKNLGKHFLYARYDADISDRGLSELGLSDVNASKLTMDNVDAIEDLKRIGAAAAKRINFAEEFSTFVPQ